MGRKGGKDGELHTPGPTPAMMAMVLLDMVLKWETMEERRMVGCMNCRMRKWGLLWPVVA